MPKRIIRPKKPQIDVNLFLKSQKEKRKAKPTIDVNVFLKNQKKNKKSLETLGTPTKNIDQLAEEAKQELEQEEVKETLQRGDTSLGELLLGQQPRETRETTYQQPGSSPYGPQRSSSGYGNTANAYVKPLRDNPYHSGNIGTYTANAYQPGNKEESYGGIRTFQGTERGTEKAESFGAARATPARKAHEAHLLGQPDPGCDYCKKAF